MTLLDVATISCDEPEIRRASQRIENEFLVHHTSNIMILLTFPILEFAAAREAMICELNNPVTRAGRILCDTI